MKLSGSLLSFLFATIASFGAETSDKLVQRRLWKAEEILQMSTEVVTSSAVGYGGALSEANWAISVIAIHDLNPIERLQRIAEHASTEGALMCLLGIKSINKIEYEKISKEWRAQTNEPKGVVEILVGCIDSRVSFKVALQTIDAWDKNLALCKNIPPLEETIRVRKSLASLTRP